ncbi:hypothetical protein DPMN_144266 [Dreissena polymorpha]|uniref:C1q domain-containing protein n=1 Tax=Dreissena polymorpha TaxID=45954 RepID=A0A9D4JKT4_DREPO|nr:hypothetical protein DPMN_144266 [Dreissena polymorpha]
MPLVLFYARHLDGQHAYIVHQDVAFKTILVNDGESYDSNTGRFTASVPGVYMFKLHYNHYTNIRANLEIVRDGRPLQSPGQYEGSYAVSVCMQAFAKVTIGDMVWMRSI